MAFDITLFQSYAVSITNDYSQTYVYNAGDDDLADVSAAGYFNDLLYRVATGDKLLVKTDTSGLSFSGTFRNDGTNVYVDWANTLWLSGQITDVSTASSSFICAPAGIITQVGGVLDTAITVATAAISFEIATVAVTGGTLVFTTAMAAGERAVATPTAANELAAAGTIEIISDGGSTTASRGNFFMKMICPAQI
jgi:hypothetical protein